MCHHSNNTGKLCTYRKIKNSFKFENYLDSVIEEKHRQSMAAFRISAHKLEIERYRYSKTCFCSLCSKDNLIYVGDEFHALMVCNTFAFERKHLFDIINNQCKNFKLLQPIDKFIYILSCESNLAIAVSKFIHCIMSIHRNDVPV